LSHYRSELLHDVKELFDHLEESSHALEQLLAVLSVFRHDRLEPTAVLEESLHVLFESKSVFCGSTDVRSESRP
jgi:hypothetical protein